MPLEIAFMKFSYAIMIFDIMLFEFHSRETVIIEISFGVKPLSSAEAYMKFLVREKSARKEWWEELNKGSLCELMQSIWRRI